jgi:hypothetical protein
VPTQGPTTQKVVCRGLKTLLPKCTKKKIPRQHSCHCSVLLTHTCAGSLSFFTSVNFFACHSPVFWACHSTTDPGQESNKLKTGISFPCLLETLSAFGCALLDEKSLFVGYSSEMTFPAFLLFLVSLC